jgi:hypothetical protein
LAAELEVAEQKTAADIGVTDLVAEDGIEAAVLGDLREGGCEAIESAGCVGDGAHGGIKHFRFEVESATVAQFGENDSGDDLPLGRIARREAAGVGVDERGEGCGRIGGEGDGFGTESMAEGRAGGAGLAFGGDGAAGACAVGAAGSDFLFGRDLHRIGWFRQSPPQNG